MGELESRLRGAWQGRVSGCMLGKAVEALSMTSGPEDLTEYLAGVDALPLRDYVPLADEPPPLLFAPCCRERIDASQPDDDLNYSVLALTLLEQHGRALTTEDVGRAWLNLLPVGMTFTAERAAYRTLVSEAHEYFALGAPAGVDLARCSDNEFQNWIGAQIRADLYGWVLPGDPSEAARLARVDAELSHRGDGVHGAVLVAAWGAAIPESEGLESALDRALLEIPGDSGAASAVELGRRVAAGWDTDCNGATVGALWALQGKPVPDRWTAPWQGRVRVCLAGQGELSLDSLVERTVAVCFGMAA